MTPPATRRPLTPLLLLLFFGSGCAALVYEVVWLQLLRFVVGASAVSLGVLLASFMGGMLLGSFGFDRCVSRSRHPLRVYAGLELGIAAFGALLPLLLPALASVYASFAGHGPANLLIRASVSALCLLPPAALMGATLPAIARWMDTTRVGVSRLGLFYGANTVGGVVGTLWASFHLLRHHDVWVASAWAMALNALVAAVALVVARTSPVGEAPPPAPGRVPAELGSDPRAPSGRRVHAAIALSGLTALGAQVVWTRLLSLLMGATVYTFSLILAVFLIGIGLGGAAGALLARRSPSPAVALGICQLALMAAIAWAAHAIPGVLPGLRFAPSDAGWAWQRMDDLLRCAVALLPATLFWGASFPLALACAGRDHADLGRATGRIYAANTAGAILGALGFSLLAIPWLGTQASQQLLVGITAGAALLILVPRLPRIGRASTPLPGVAAVSAALLLVALGAGLAARSIPALSEGLVTYGRVVADWGIEHDRFRVREGTSATVAVTREAAEGFRSLHVSGKVVASTYPYDMRLQRMLGHLPALLHPSPKSVLVVGFGAGVTAGAFALHPEVERITIVEIEPEVAALAGDFFAAENHRVLEDPRTRIVFDDARHFVATTSETFDVVTSDPIHPWVKGAAALYTREYFELVKRRLNPGGVVTQWVPFYQTSERAVKSEIATFLDAFPHGTIWNTHEAGKGYDVTLMGQDGPARIRAEVIQARLDANPRVRESLHAVGIRSALDLMAAFAGQRSDMDGWLADAELNLDRSLRLEYLAGEAVDLQAEDRIVHAMAGRLSYPQQLFVVNDEQERSLRQSLRANLR